MATKAQKAHKMDYYAHMNLNPKPQGEREMGLTHIAVELRNLRAEAAVTITFLVDTGAMESMAPAASLRSIGIQPIGKRMYELASGEHIECEYGHVEMRFLNENIATDIIFGADTDALLGVVALESAGFIVDPKSQTLKKLKAFPLKSAVAAK